MTPAKRNYSITERKCLAMVFSVKKYRHYLVCNPVVFFVNHMNIKYLVNKVKLSGRFPRWIWLLEEFDYTVEYKPGRIHLQAHHLSRLSKKMGESSIDDRLVDDGQTGMICGYCGVLDHTKVARGLDQRGEKKC